MQQQVLKFLFSDITGIFSIFCTHSKHQWAPIPLASHLLEGTLEVWQVTVELCTVHWLRSSSSRSSTVDDANHECSLTACKVQYLYKNCVQIYFIKRWNWYTPGYHQYWFSKYWSHLVGRLLQNKLGSRSWFSRFYAVYLWSNLLWHYKHQIPIESHLISSNYTIRSRGSFNWYSYLEGR